MIDHTAVNVSDYEAAKSFYAEALRPLGYSLAFEAGDYIGFADEGWTLGVVRRDPVGGARRVQVRRPRDGGRVPCSRDRGRRHRQRPPGIRRTTTSTTTARSCSMPTATTSRRSARSPVIRQWRAPARCRTSRTKSTASVTATPSAAALGELPGRRRLRPARRASSRPARGRSSRARRTSRRGRACPRESPAASSCARQAEHLAADAREEAAATSVGSDSGSRGRRAVRAGAGSRTSRPAACAAAQSRPTRPPTSRLMACSVRIAPTPSDCPAGSRIAATSAAPAKTMRASIAIAQPGPKAATRKPAMPRRRSAPR